MTLASKAVAVLLLAAACPAPLAAQTAAPPQQSRAQQLMGDVDPKLAELTDTVLFGDVWERPEMSKRDRSLVTVAALIASTVRTSSAPTWRSRSRTGSSRRS